MERLHLSNQLCSFNGFFSDYKINEIFMIDNSENEASKEKTKILMLPGNLL